LIHLGFHDFPLQLYHAEWPGVSDKNITVIKSYISNGSRTEMKELLAYISDLNNITGNLNVSQRTTTQSLTVSSDASISGSLTVGSGPINGLHINGTLIAMNDALVAGSLTVYGNVVGNPNTTISNNLVVNGDITCNKISGNVDASSITSGMVNSARLPNLNNFNYYASGGGITGPSWCKIITIYKPNEIYGPIKFNIIGARGQASGWSPNFDEDYYIRVRYNGTTVFETSYRNVNVSFGAMKLGFVRVDNNTTEAYLYRETADTIWGSILFNKYATDVLTIYNNSPILTEDPGAVFLPMRTNIPTPPATGTYTLQSNNGVLSWI
jgi:hypothetical protein